MMITYFNFTLKLDWSGYILLKISFILLFVLLLWFLGAAAQPLTPAALAAQWKEKERVLARVERSATRRQPSK